ATILRRAGDLTGAERLFRDLLARTPEPPEARAALAQVLYEAGHLEEARTHAAEAVRALPADQAANSIETLIGILLGLGRPDEALPLIHQQRLRQPRVQSWIAYEATAARLLDLPLYRDLYDYDRFVQCYDVEPGAGWASITEFNAALLRSLDARHRFAVHPL